MLDIKFIRENRDLIAAAAKKKMVAFNVDDLIAVDDKRRSLLALAEKRRAEQNSANSQIVSTITPEERAALITQMKVVKTELEKTEAELKDSMKVWQDLMLRVPNIPICLCPTALLMPKIKKSNTGAIGRLSPSSPRIMSSS